MLQDRADKICEMAGVMNQSIQIDEERYAKEQELMSRLLTENKVFLPINISTICFLPKFRRIVFITI